MRLHHKSLCHILCGGAVVIATPPASAAFVEDSKASIDLRNFYMNRDFRSGTGQSKAEEWAQGFMLKMESGYTEGPIGFGVDAIGLLGVKLDSSPDRVGTGILQSDRDAPNQQMHYNPQDKTLRSPHPALADKCFTLNRTAM